jgi:hypothetical protein
VLDYGRKVDGSVTGCALDFSHGAVEKFELENSLMKPLTTPIIVVLVVALAVIGYFYYQRTRNDITIQMPKVEMKR